MILRFALFLILSLALAPAYAECSRTDIDYYLSKGFTHEQVTALCSDAKSEQQPYRPYEDRDAAEDRRRDKEKKQEDDILTLKTSLNAWDVELNPKRLAYTRKFCIAAGKTPEVEGRTRICPEVRYYVYFKGLKVAGNSRKYFFVGQREITVTGTVKRKMLHDLKNYPEDLRRELLNSFKSRTNKEGTAIPIRRDMPLTQVMDILREYAY